jgi:hypothetical protein
MDLLNIAQTVLGSVAPAIVTGLAGPQAGMVARVVANTLLGKPDAPHDAIAAALEAATPDQIERLRQIDANLELELAKIVAQDRADARALQTKALASGDTYAAHFIYNFAWFWSVSSVAYFFFVTFYPMPSAGKDFALTILGFLLGTAVATILGFFYGSADKHNGKR